MPDNELTSIIIASKNEGNNLKRTVDSVFKNTDHNSFEIVVVDDGSSNDDSAFLNLEPYKKDSRLRYIRLEGSQGCVRARQQGVLQSKGDNLLFLDAHTALTPGWLYILLGTLDRWGPNVLITPDISGLDGQNWLSNESSGLVMSIDEKFDLTWVEAPYPSWIVPLVGGGCVLTSRNFFNSIGGFDLGLQRWGCEFIDLSLKAYAAGGTCMYEPSVLVGHLFRESMPYEMGYSNINYNKLRTAYIHFEDEFFTRLAFNIQDDPEYNEGYRLFQRDFEEIEKIRLSQRTSNTRPLDWYRRVFLDNQIKETELTSQIMSEIPSRRDQKMNNEERLYFECPNCGSFNYGELNACLRCGSPITQAEIQPDLFTCPQCGEQLSSKLNFCIFCGTRLNSEPQSEDELCTQCGKVLLTGKKFCTECGAKIE